MQHWALLESLHKNPFQNLQPNNYSVKHLFYSRAQVSFITLTPDPYLDFPFRYPLSRSHPLTFPPTYLDSPFRYLGIHFLQSISPILPCHLMPSRRKGSLQRVNQHVQQVALEINPGLIHAIRMNFMFLNLRTTSYRGSEGCPLNSQVSTITLWKLL